MLRTTQKSTRKTPLPIIRFAILAADIVCFRIIEGKLCVLIGKVTSQSAFQGKWALIGGLILPKETAEAAAERLLRDKAGIGHLYKEQLYTFSDIDRDPRGRVVSVAYLALTAGEPRTIFDNTVETKWCQLDQLPDLAYDHDDILSLALERLRSKLTYTPIAKHLLSSKFTLTELQSVFEVVLGQSLDKRNFRKKMLTSGVLINTKKTRKEGIMRPAALYTFI